ncbi:hypothetical protein HB991_09730 [Yersinia mollaretii]|uniref:Uncharacterized protein n=1 Tax=Yersinia mollaretii TaxID=33060 RepID=A0AA44CLA9_YERMO|nr:hypothetical protein [Yersinia mollaretii]NIL22787.1 hypothetical protein [Yersinia mollaretii]CNI67470.1 Uncharacterised protein [Yersinia mollaretii]CQQ85099.1 Uncharacterised protein [Yersinia mollaretii]
MIDNNHTSEDSTVETRIFKGKSGNNNFNIDLGESSYVISDSGGIDTLTFKNTKVENLEYSIKDGRHYIRDKQTQHVVTFDDAGYAERNRNIDEACDYFESIYYSTDMEKAIEAYSDTNIKLNNLKDKISELYKIAHNEINQKDLFSRPVNNIIHNLDELISIAGSRGDKQSSQLFLELKIAFNDYTYFLVDSATNHNIIEMINIDGKRYNVKDLLVSTALDVPSATPGGDISDLADITDVKILKNGTFDYTEQELENINIEQYNTNTMIEYMAEFKDLGQQLGIQELPFYSSSDFMPPIVQVN